LVVTLDNLFCKEQIINTFIHHLYKNLNGIHILINIAMATAADSMYSYKERSNDYKCNRKISDLNGWLKCTINLDMFLYKA